MYAMYKELHPPTGIEHSIHCHFYNMDQYNLVVAGANQLSVYRLILATEAKSSSAEKTLAESKRMKLECLATYQLFGVVQSIRSVNLSGSCRDSLMLSFKDAKLSIVEYDPSTNGLKTLSLHFFEDEDVKDGFITNYNRPNVRVDPDGRCAVMLIYGTRLVVLPFRKEGVVEEIESNTGAGKLPVMSSYMIDMHRLDECITNIIDLQFLHGYYEPTLFILYEPMQTWAGRVAARIDSCSIVAISLNIREKVHPIIWSISNLPFDCLQAMTVPKPIGGALVFAANSLLYLNQSFPPLGVSLNGFSDNSTAFPLKIQEGVKISLDCAQASFAAFDRLVISLKGGELYVLTLLADGMRSVRGFHFDKAASSVLTTCICTLENGYLFLGSRVGNSLLLKYTEKLPDNLVEPKRSDSDTKKLAENPSKRKRLDTMGDWMASDVAEVQDPEELEVYGEAAMQTGTQLSQYSFEVCDSILNICPCGWVSMGEPAFLSEEFQNSLDPDIELVTTSGHGKNGALSILQRTIRPQVVTTFELPGCYDMWTVVGPQTPEKDIVQKKDGSDGEEDIEEEKPTVIPNSHAFLILSRSDSSMILQTGHEINELDHSGFNTQGPTVFAGNMGKNQYIVQVNSAAVRLLRGVEMQQEVLVELNAPIVHATLADPYLVIASEEGEFALLKLQEDADGNAKLSLTKSHVHNESKVLALSAYKDTGGLFTTKPTDGDVPADQYFTNLPAAAAKREENHEVPVKKLDDEDELLYGESAELLQPLNGADDEEIQREANASPHLTELHVEATHWLAVARDDGMLQICSLPDFSVCFVVRNFPAGKRVLVDHDQENTAARTVNEKPAEEVTSTQEVKELMLVGLGNMSSRPHLLARVNEELLIYEAFPYRGHGREKHLRLRFSKVPINLLLKEKKVSKSRKKAEAEQKAVFSKHVNRLRYFEDIAGYSGIFVCGHYPHWLFMSQRGILRAHPMGIDGSVTCFSPFHNVNCPKGFLYFNRQGELRIAVLPTHLSYDAPWPVRKVPLRCTPHFICYHLDSKTYALVTSVPVTCNRSVKMVGEEKEIETVERDDRFIYPTIEKFSVQLFSPVSWEAIPNTSIEFEDWEHITCLKNVSLKSEGTVSGLKGYLAVGTNISYSDEITCRGRILLLDVIEVVPEPGQPLTKNKIKVLYDEEQKGPVTSLTQVAGHLLGAIGQKIYMWELNGDQLVARAFIDTQIYVHQTIGLKNFVLVADIVKSISLLRYQEETKTLSLISKDIKPMDVLGIEYFIDNTQIAFLATDTHCNVFLYLYQPEARESCGGQRLVRRADINIGSRVVSMFRVRCKIQDPSTDKKASSSVEKKQVTFFATLDGSLSYLLPMTEKTYRRLLMLQNALVIHIPHNAGLNPRAYRMVKSGHRMLANQNRNILDGDLLWKFLHLSMGERTELCKKIGTTSDQIIEDLQDADRQTAHI
ncbi:PREDICTED: cleavage and polyadenylation specificity factor subunit 1-like isoform X2 [Priapulus caudatus]|uniref:Cleavage and polyadenylation specificity factor subunit 1-like isoform X2 n=1 Tax=Priapulus caudatus TaxID=37621 RepID=A0ABM1EEA9_PRICU|nr:PREDICTED: cleavage and polyadenylation specificity factor subunit 1-like isoform X2 [Priapulus caudatus]